MPWIVWVILGGGAAFGIYEWWQKKHPALTASSSAPQISANMMPLGTVAASAPPGGTPADSTTSTTADTSTTSQTPDQSQQQPPPGGGGGGGSGGPGGGGFGSLFAQTTSPGPGSGGGGPSVSPGLIFATATQSSPLSALSLAAQAATYPSSTTYYVVINAPKGKAFTTLPGLGMLQKLLDRLSNQTTPKGPVSIYHGVSIGLTPDRRQLQYVVRSLVDTNVPPVIVQGYAATVAHVPTKASTNAAPASTLGTGPA